MKVLHVITGLEDGGAESALYRLCKQRRVDHTVISLTSEGKYAAPLREANVSVQCLNLRSGRLTLSGFHRLITLIRAQDPDVVQCWMYHANLVGGVAARLAGHSRVVWCIRNSDLPPKSTALSTRMVNRASALVSSLVPDAIVSCAASAAQLHISMGYDPRKMAVVPNGYELGLFQRDDRAGAALREQWGIKRGANVIGMVGRWHAQKDHANLFSAVARTIKHYPDTVCVLAGAGMDDRNDALSAALGLAGVTERVRLLGPRQDVPHIMSALDVNVLSSSFGEAFPNVVAEAMACMTPSVVTDVGDAEAIVADTGWAVPKSDPKALSAAIISALTEHNTDPSTWRLRQLKCRQRVEENYSIMHMARAFETVWSSATPEALVCAA